MPVYAAPPPRPVPFLEAAPLVNQNLRPGEIPRQFTFTLLGDAFVCEREGRVPSSGSGQGDKGGGTGGVAESDVGRVSVLCDGANKLLVRGEGNTMTTDAFSFASACESATRQFRTNAGCFCDPRHAIVCLERGPTLSVVGSGFSFASACDGALKKMDRGVEVRFRSPGK